MKKVILSYLKMSLCVCVRKVGVPDEGKREVVCVWVGWTV